MTLGWRTAPAIASLAHVERSPECCWDDAWAHALDALELAVDRAEALLRAGHDCAEHAEADAARWSPPTLGPLPEHLAVRARRLLQRQLDVAEALSRAMHDNRQQAALLDRIEGARQPRRPSYVDSAF